MLTCWQYADNYGTTATSHYSKRKVGQPTNLSFFRWRPAQHKLNQGKHWKERAIWVCCWISNPLGEGDDKSKWNARDKFRFHRSIGTQNIILIYRPDKSPTRLCSLHKTNEVIANPWFANDLMLSKTRGQTFLVTLYTFKE